VTARTEQILADLPSLRFFERGWLSSNNVLFLDDEERATLVDSGYVSHGEQTLALIRQALQGRRLARIVNTHLHSDHCGGNALLKRVFDPEILIPPGHAAAVAAWDEDVLSFRAMAQSCERFTHDGLVMPGQTLSMGGLAWQAHSSPGHDPQSIMLWCADHHALISADVLWENGFGGIFPEVEGESGFAEQRAILDLIAQLAPALVLPGHGAPFTDVEGALARARARLDALEASPERNARHVAKVLIKYHLLEVRVTTLGELTRHFAAARYFSVINERYFRLQFGDMIARLVGELSSSGAVVIIDGRIENRD
jgi:glyoxylase-like metal-dependent hydrolase (beta-lactamase superfamily II)